MVICSDTYVGNALYPRKSPKSRAVSDCIICRSYQGPFLVEQRKKFIQQKMDCQGSQRGNLKGREMD